MRGLIFHYTDTALFSTSEHYVALVSTSWYYPALVTRCVVSSFTGQTQRCLSPTLASSLESESSLVVWRCWSLLELLMRLREMSLQTDHRCWDVLTVLTVSWLVSIVILSRAGAAFCVHHCPPLQFHIMATQHLYYLLLSVHSILRSKVLTMRLQNEEFWWYLYSTSIVPDWHKENQQNH